MSVNYADYYCPDCETPNQFGEVCGRCLRERDYEQEYFDEATEEERFKQVLERQTKLAESIYDEIISEEER